MRIVIQHLPKAMRKQQNFSAGCAGEFSDTADLNFLSVVGGKNNEAGIARGGPWAGNRFFIVVVNTSIKQNVIILSFTLKLNFQNLFEKMDSSQL